MDSTKTQGRDKAEYFLESAGVPTTLFLASPDGALHELVVDNDGRLSTRSDPDE